MTARPSLGSTRLGQPGDAAPLVIALGDRKHTPDAWLTPLCDHFSLFALEAPRAADPRRFGVPSRSGDWFLEDECGPEPSSFGLALIALERFVLDEPRRPILLGLGQGATLCLALARCWAEALVGVVAIDGRLAELPTASIEETPLLGLPIMLFEGNGDGDCDGDSERDRAQLAGRGACVTIARHADPQQIGSQLACWLENIASPSGEPRRVERDAGQLPRR